MWYGLSFIWIKYIIQWVKMKKKGNIRDSNNSNRRDSMHWKKELYHFPHFFIHNFVAYRYVVQLKTLCRHSFIRLFVLFCYFLFVCWFFVVFYLLSQRYHSVYYIVMVLQWNESFLFTFRHTAPSKLTMNYVICLLHMYLTRLCTCSRAHYHRTPIP